MIPDKKQKKKQQDRRMVMDALVMVLQFGINMLVPIFMCTFLGIWIGNRTGLNWMAVPCFFVGAAAGANNIYRAAKKLIDKSNSKRQ